METYWNEISKLDKEADLDKFMEFLTLMKEENLLTPFLFSGACHGLIVRGAYQRAWDLLHELASKQGDKT